MERNPLPQRDVRVAEFMADKPNGDRYEVRYESPNSHYVYRVEFKSPDNPQLSATVAHTQTLWGARMEIRRHRKRVMHHGELTGSLVYWERF